MSPRGASRPAFDALGVLALKGFASGLVLLGGFRAVSDDDFARVVLAQRFAEAPALDPTGSSWLPLPFWVYGALQALFGPSLTVARVTASALGLASGLLVWWAARLLGSGRWAALLGAGLAALLPYAARLGVATVPEAPAAALCVLAAATLGGSARARCWGAAALFAACASRYEPWSVAAVFAVFSLRDALRLRQPGYFAAAAIALTFPLLWLLHGSVRHGDALFFVERVAAYRAALGLNESWVGRLARIPRELMAEPELMLGALVAAAWLRSRSVQLLTTQGTRRFVLALAALPLFLLLGALRGSSPTHHGERALLAVWLGAALLLGLACELARERFPLRERRLFAGSLLAAALLGGLLRTLHPVQPFQARGQEVDIGLRARQRSIERLAIDAPDFGYFAVQAAFARPWRSVPLNTHDPRAPRGADLLREKPHTVRAALARQEVQWLALPRARAPLAHAVGDVREGNADWLLLELK